MLTGRFAGGFVHLVPGGAATLSASLESTKSQETLIGPCGVGTTPLADVTSPACGVTVKVAKPGDVGRTPRTYSTSTGAAPLDQPWS